MRSAGPIRSTAWWRYPGDAREAGGRPDHLAASWPAPSAGPVMMIMISAWRPCWPARARIWRSTSTPSDPWRARSRLFCSGMNVPDAPYVLQLPNVSHLATDITAVADTGRGLSSALCGGSASDCRGLRYANRQRSFADRRAGASGSRAVRRTSRLDRRERRRRVGDRAALRPAQRDRSPPDPALSPAVASSPDQIHAAELAESNAKLIPMRESLGPVCRCLSKKAVVRSIERRHWRSKV